MAISKGLLGLFSALLVSMSVAATKASAESGFLCDDIDAATITYCRDSRTGTQVQYSHWEPCSGQEQSYQEHAWQDVSGCNSSNNGAGWSNQTTNNIYSQRQMNTYQATQQVGSTLPPARFGLLAPSNVSLQNRRTIYTTIYCHANR